MVEVVARHLEVFVELYVGAEECDEESENDDRNSHDGQGLHIDDFVDAIDIVVERPDDEEQRCAGQSR